MSNNSIAIETFDLTKKYGSLIAVDKLNLKVKRGEIFGFLGPNGAGKTTTIKLMTGLLKPTSGTVKIMSKDVQKDPIGAKADIGLIPEEPQIYDKLTGMEFLRFIGNLFGMDRVKIEKKIGELLKLFDLTNRGEELIQGYSHGMTQKIAIAGALIHSPKVLFFDVSFEAMTFSHFLEDKFKDSSPIKLYEDEPVESTVIDAEGKRISVKTFVFSKEAIENRNDSLLEKELTKKNILKTFRIGNTKLMSANLKEVLTCAEEMVKSGMHF